jgi:hypothetical protein
MLDVLRLLPQVKRNQSSVPQWRTDNATSGWIISGLSHSLAFIKTKHRWQPKRQMADYSDNSFDWSQDTGWAFRPAATSSIITVVKVKAAYNTGIIMRVIYDSCWTLTLFCFFRNYSYEYYTLLYMGWHLQGKANNVLVLSASDEWPVTCFMALDTIHWHVSEAERVNVVLGIYKHYPGSISSLKQYPGYTSLKPNITQHRNKIPAFEVVSRVAVVTWTPKGKWRRWSIVFSDDRDPG